MRYEVATEIVIMCTVLPHGVLTLWTEMYPGPLSYNKHFADKKYSLILYAVRYITALVFFHLTSHVKIILFLTFETVCNRRLTM